MVLRKRSRFLAFYLLYFICYIFHTSGSFISRILFILYFFIPLGDLIPSILFMLYFSYFYLFGDVRLNYSIVSYEEYYADW